MASPRGDVREALRASLDWKFAYASSDPQSARCLVPHPQDATQLAEWLVRELPSLQQSVESKTGTPPRPSAINHHSNRLHHDLETLLAQELGFGHVQHLFEPLTHVSTQARDVWELQQVILSIIVGYPLIRRGDTTCCQHICRYHRKTYSSIYTRRFQCTNQ